MIIIEEKRIELNQNLIIDQRIIDCQNVCLQTMYEFYPNSQLSQTTAKFPRNVRNSINVQQHYTNHRYHGCQFKQTSLAADQPTSWSRQLLNSAVELSAEESASAFRARALLAKLPITLNLHVKHRQPPPFPPTSIPISSPEWKSY